MQTKSFPGKMPINMSNWMAQLGQPTFINAYYQYRDIANISPNKNILIVGPGQGLIVEILKWKKFNVVTIDVDPVTNPDHICSVHEMEVFGNKEFDVVLVSHVLEHIPHNLLDSALSELSRVATHAIIYIPIAGKHFSLKCDFGIRDLSFSIFFDCINPRKFPDQERPVFCEGQHYWELGVPGYKKLDMRKRITKNFNIIIEYRNKDWPVSYNYILKSKLV